MYAVVKAGGRQIKVSHGQTVKIDLINAEPGSTHIFTDVLMIGGGPNVHVGTPTLPHVALEAEVLGHGKAPKVIIFKKRRRKNFRRKRGFRAQFTLVKITHLKGVDLPWQAPQA